MPIDVRINGLRGYLCTIHAEPWWKYRELKQKIETTLSLETSSFCVLYGDTKILSAKFLQKLPVGSNADLTVLMLELSKQERDSALRKIEPNLSVQERNASLQTLQKKVWLYREFVRAAVKQNGRMLEIASDELRADRKIVLAAVHTDGSALEFASDELRADRNIVFAAVYQAGSALEFASSELRADREIVLVAVRQASSGLEFASDELRADREIVLAATYRGHRRDIRKCCSPWWSGWFCVRCNHQH